MRFDVRCNQKTIAAVVALVLSALAFAETSARAQDTSRTESLDNGITVLMKPIADTGQVAVESFYDVGFLHEPAGLPQSAHLLEHLVCHAAMPGFEPGEAFAKLNEIGLANAETMPAFTHYDAFVPAGELETVLRIEAARLRGLAIDEAIIRQEGPRCCQEVDFVEQVPQAGMLKFAFMALAQAWRHGGDDVTIRSGLDAFPVEAMQRLFDCTYLPRNLKLIIVGDFNPDEAMKLVRTHLGGIENAADAEPVPPIDWTGAPKRSTVTWDSSTRAVCIAFPPPDDLASRIALSTFGATMTAGLTRRDNGLADMTNITFASGLTWPVGELPFFVYAAVKPDASIEDVETMLIEELQSTLERQAPRIGQQLAVFARVPALNRQRADRMVDGMAASIERTRGMPPDRARAMALGQVAIDWGMSTYFLGPDPDAAVAAVEAVTAADVERIIREHLAADRMIVTHILPREDVRHGGEGTAR